MLLLSIAFQTEPPMKTPKNRFLRSCLSWIIYAVGTRLVMGLVLDTRTWEGMANAFLTKFCMTYTCGAVWSDFPLIAFLAIIAALTTGVALFFPSNTSRVIAKLSFSVVTVLSLFTIWLEPWMTVTGVATNVVFALVKVSFMIVDIGVTIGWLIVWRMFFHYLNTDFCEAPTPVQPRVTAARKVSTRPSQEPEVIEAEAIPALSVPLEVSPDEIECLETPRPHLPTAVPVGRASASKPPR
jgi:hypothetical protein